MGKLAKPANRLLFALCVLITGAIAGAFVWAFFFCMDIGLGLLWEKLPQTLGAAAGQEVPPLASGPFGFAAWPLIVCLIGGLAIGLYDKHVGFAPEELNVVMGKVKGEGRYPYDHLGKRSLSALLPLLFGGSVGPEAGLTGVIAGLCTWVGDRMRRFGADFRAMTVAGTQAALTALFTAPLYGFAAPLAGTADGRVPEGEVDIKLPRAGKAAVYLCAVVGALGAFFGLAELIGGGGGLPRFSAANVGPREALRGWCRWRLRARPAAGHTTLRARLPARWRAVWATDPSQRRCWPAWPWRFAAWRFPTPCSPAKRSPPCSWRAGPPSRRARWWRRAS